MLDRPDKMFSVSELLYTEIGRTANEFVTVIHNFFAKKYPVLALRTGLSGYFRLI
jgi:hypothetical protein